MDFRSSLILLPNKGLKALFERYKDIPMNDDPIEIATVSVQAVNPHIVTEGTDLPAIYFRYGDTRLANAQRQGTNQIREVFSVLVFAHVNVRPEDEVPDAGTGLIKRTAAMQQLVSDVATDIRTFPTSNDIFLENVVVANCEILNLDRAPSRVQIMGFNIEFTYLNTRRCTI